MPGEVPPPAPRIYTSGTPTPCSVKPPSGGFGRAVDLQPRALDQPHEVDPDLRYSVRQNVWPEDARISFSRSVTKHRISRERSLYVIEHCGIQLVDWFWNPATSDVDRKVYFLGDDLEAVGLEVVAAESAEDDFKVIHAMEVRNRFRALYEEARQWAK